MRAAVSMPLPVRVCPGCGVTFTVRRRDYLVQQYCERRCYTVNGPFGSARNGRLEEQHVQREVRPA